MTPEDTTPPPVIADAVASVPEPAAADPLADEQRPFISPLEVIAIGTIVVVDQLSKFIVRTTIPLYEKHVVIPSLLDVTHVQNTGAAFGLLNAANFPYKSAVMIGIATLALVAISITRASSAPTSACALRPGADLGGAFGNLIDGRSTTMSSTVGIYRGTRIQAFNVADAAIAVGAILVLPR